jgi:hypothetical protein
VTVPTGPNYNDPNQLGIAIQTQLRQKMTQTPATQGITLTGVTCVHSSGPTFTCAWNATNALGEPIGGNENYVVSTDGQSFVSQGSGSGG